MEEINDMIKFPSKKDKEETPRYVMIRFGTPDSCAFKYANPDIPTAKMVLDSLEKIPILEIVDNLSYKAIGIFYEAVEKQKTKTESKAEKSFQMNECSS